MVIPALNLLTSTFQSETAVLLGIIYSSGNALPSMSCYLSRNRRSDAEILSKMLRSVSSRDPDAEIDEKSKRRTRGELRDLVSALPILSLPKVLLNESFVLIS